MCNISSGVSVGFSLGSGWKAADREPIRASVATLVLPTKSPLNWACAHRSEGSLFGHWRSGMEFAQVSCRSTRRGVREHPAPSGALRPVRRSNPSLHHRCVVREHPAPSGALRPMTTASLRYLRSACQGAPSTIRCIETFSGSFTSSMLETSQGAPSTIRCIETTYCNLFKRKFVGRGAPSTIRCIKTGTPLASRTATTGSGSAQHHQVH